MNRTRSKFRDLAALPVVLVLGHAPEIGGLAAMVLTTWVVQAVVVNPWIGALASFAGGLGALWALTVLPRRPRPVADMLLELADRAADWAGWGWTESRSASETDPYETEVNR